MPRRSSRWAPELAAGLSDLFTCRLERLPQALHQLVSTITHSLLQVLSRPSQVLAPLLSLTVPFAFHCLYLPHGNKGGGCSISGSRRSERPAKEPPPCHSSLHRRGTERLPWSYWLLGAPGGCGCPLGGWILMFGAAGWAGGLMLLFGAGC